MNLRNLSKAEKSGPQLVLRQELSCDSSNAGWDFFETRKLRVVLQGKMVQQWTAGALCRHACFTSSHDWGISWTSSHQCLSQHPLSWTPRRGLDGRTQRCHHCLIPFISEEEERGSALRAACLYSFILQGLAVYSYHSLCTTSETNVIACHHKDSALRHSSMLDLCSSEISEAFLHKHKNKRNGSNRNFNPNNSTNSWKTLLKHEDNLLFQAYKAC